MNKFFDLYAPADDGKVPMDLNDQLIAYEKDSGFHKINFRNLKIVVAGGEKLKPAVKI